MGWKGNESQYSSKPDRCAKYFTSMILIPNNRAIELLQNRLNELNRPGTDLEAWKNRVLIDVEGIFGKRSSQWFAIFSTSTLHFDKPEKINQITTTFSQTISGYIQYIRDFHIINQEKVELSEEEYKKKYLALLEKWNELVPDYNKLVEDYQTLHKEHDEALTEIKMLQEKLENETDYSDYYKILFLGASPINEVRLRIDEEVRDIENGLKLAALRDNFELVQKWAVTTKTLQQAMLDEHPHIVHFSGHGDTAGIAIEDLLGNAKIVDTDALGSLFELFSDTVKCVFLNSCYSETQAKEISKHIPYVIGMKNSVADKAAIAFAVGFYTALGAGKDIKFAYRMGVVSIKLEGVTGSEIPVLIG